MKLLKNLNNIWEYILGDYPQSTIDKLKPSYFPLESFLTKVSDNMEEALQDIKIIEEHVLDHNLNGLRNLLDVIKEVK